MTLVVVLLKLLTILWIYFLWSRRKYYAFALKMPGPMGLPLIGVLHKFYKLEELLYKFPNMAMEYKAKSIHLWLGHFPVVYSMEPKIVEIILNSPDCINKSFVYDVLHDVVGVGLLTSKSETWQVHRKLINPAFRHKVLVNFFPNFNKLSRELCGELDEAVGCVETNIKELTFSLAIKSALATTMGYDFSKKSISTLKEDFEMIQVATVSRILNPWLNISFIFQRSNIYNQYKKSRDNIMEFVHGIVRRKIKLLQKENQITDNQKSNSMEESVDIKRKKHIFIDRAIEIHQRNEFTINDIVTEANIIVIAGTETTGITLFSVLMYLSMFPQYQERAFEEIYALFPDEKFDVTYEDLENLTFLDMCLNETLRMSPGIPLIARECTKDVPISEGLVISKGTQVLIDIFNMQRDKDVWGPTADTFDPDHFLPSNVDTKNGYAYLPFSKGPRNCIGWQYGMMILKVSLVYVLRKYRFTTKYKFSNLLYINNLALTYKTWPNLEVHRR